MSEHHIYLEPKEARRRYQILWEQSYIDGCESPCGL